MNISLVQLSDQRRQIASQVVRVTLWVVMLATCGILLLFSFSEPPLGADLHARHVRVGMSALVPLGSAIGLALLSRGLLMPAVALVSWILYAVPMTLAIIVGLGVHSIGMALWPVVIMLLGFAWGTVAAVGVTVLFVASIIGLLLAELGGVLPGPTMATLGGPIFFGSVLFLLVVLVCWLTIRYSSIFVDALEAATSSHRELESSNLALRQSENLLQQNQHRMEELLSEQKAMLENDLVGIVTVRNRAVVWANPAYERMLGYAPGELTGAPTSQIYPGEEAYRAFGAAAYPVLSAGNVFRTPIEHVRKDGGRIWVDLSGAVLDPESGESLWVLIDITDRRNVEQRLAQSEERMELALAGADLGMWDLDVQSGRITHDLRLITMLGYAHGGVEVTAKTFLSLLHPEDAAKFDSVFYAHLKGETPNFEGEYRMRHKDGHWVWLLSRGKVVERDKDGRAVRMTGTSLDISERKRSEAALAARETRLSTLIASMQDMVFLFDSAGIVVEYFHPSPSPRPSYKPREYVLGKNYAEILPANVALLFHDAIAGIMMDGQSRTFEYSLTIGGIEYLSQARMSPLIGETKYPTGFLTVVRDITAERASQREIERLAHANTLLLESVGEGIYGVDLANRATFVNSAAQAMLGFTEAELHGHEQHALFHHHRQDGAPYPASECPIRLTVEDGHVRHDENEWFWRKDGSGFPVAMTVTPVVENERRVGAVVIFQDISERKANEAKIRDLAFFDPLTQLPNRRLLFDRLEHSMAASQRSGCYGAVMFLDLDNFKPLNDAHGHAVGDLLLREVANRLRSCVRVVDTVARFGGDEFVVMLGELTADREITTSQAGIIAEKIRRTLSEPYVLTIKREGVADTSVEHHCTASIGVALFLDHEATQDEVLKWADNAMYQAKEAGRNSVQFATATLQRIGVRESVAANFMQLTWRPAYQCGDALIDDQHRALMGDANRLLTAILSGKPADEAAKLIDALIRDAAQHFKDEEAIISATDFPGSVEHATIHRQLVDSAVVLIGRFHAGTLGIGELFQFLAYDVITRHILGEDRKFFPYLEHRR